MDGLEFAISQVRVMRTLNPNPWEAIPDNEFPWLYEVLIDGEADRWAELTEQDHSEWGIPFRRLLHQIRPMPAHCSIAMPDPTPTRYATEWFV